MKVETRYHGVIEIDKSELIEFPQGIPGFIGKKEFVLLRLSDDSPFFIIQSTEDVNIAFITLTPWDVLAGYEFEISQAIEKLLKVDDPNDVLVFVICTIKGELENMTVNLAAPVVINFRENLGKQVVLDDSKYSIKHPAFTKQQRQEAK